MGERIDRPTLVCLYVRGGVCRWVDIKCIYIYIYIYIYKYKYVIK